MTKRQIKSDFGVVIGINSNANDIGKFSIPNKLTQGKMIVNHKDGWVDSLVL